MPLTNKGSGAAQKVHAIMAELDDKDLEEAKTAFLESLDEENVDTKIIDGKEIVETKALIDCGTQGTFMDE